MPQRRTSLIVLIVLLFARPMIAQDNATHYAQLQKDAQEAQAYTFTMDTLTRTLKAGNEMEVEMKADNLLPVMNAARGKGVYATIHQITAAYSASPKLIAIASANGFTPRSLAVALWSWLGTLMSMGAEAQGKSMDALPGPFRPNAANIKFCQDHKDEVKPLYRNYPFDLKVLLPFDPR